ncbi:DUF4287 domain-containing protein [Abyssibacter sp.]|jgi:hypothetical protein|uniref:DUF4287 domain-containing protein n=1 Tax=Abyssibacter sp. TaxID=2320200 RepID=UPI0025C66172|nr:DUF4287 domain-containing protein [Abyssibacter sp.]MCK5860143.1 DUF4287 domain-containing protein [Abyssibacter sp.]
MADAVSTMIENLRVKTGKSLADWVGLAKGSGADKHGAMVGWLKSEHGLTHGYANLIAHETFRSAASHADADELVAAQYAGKKSVLKAHYDQLIAVVQGFGGDVEIAPKKAYVSLRRSKQFALIQPSTATRLDLGLVLKGVEPGAVLEASGSFNAMCTHRIRIAVDGPLPDAAIQALRQAYDAA